MSEILRPKMANEALELLEQGNEIEIETEFVFAFLRVAENHRRRSLKFKCKINGYNQGFTAIKLKK